jgi:hypothetical protein
MSPAPSPTSTHRFRPVYGRVWLEVVVVAGGVAEVVLDGLLVTGAGVVLGAELDD